MVFLGPNSIGSVYGPSGYAAALEAANKKAKAQAEKRRDPAGNPIPEALKLP